MTGTTVKGGPLISVTCWCESTEVMVPVEWVSEGRTGSCDRPGCANGCTPLDHEDTEDTEYTTSSDRARRIKMNRFKTSDYAPLDDSSVAQRVGAVRDANPSALILEVGDGLCPCGCAEAPKGKTAKFGMGHDIRLRGKLIRALASGAKVVTVHVDTQVTNVYDPDEFAAFYSTDKLDWPESVRTGAARITTRAKHNDRAVLEAATGPKPGDRELIKVGRWDYDGRVVAIYKVENGTELEFEYSDKKGEIHRVRRTADGQMTKVAS